MIIYYHSTRMPCYNHLICHLFHEMIFILVIYYSRRKRLSRFYIFASGACTSIMKRTFAGGEMVEQGFDGNLKMIITRHYLLCSGNK